jgi:DNA-binding helix-hairpin-helix protein with protein kinase domain
VQTPYELSAEQVVEMKEWLRPWDPCPWCERERPWSPEMAHVDQPITHRADCLLALVTEEARHG